MKCRRLVPYYIMLAGLCRNNQCLFIFNYAKSHFINGVRVSSGSKLQKNLTSSWVKMFLMCLKQPSAISKSSTNVLPLKIGWGALLKKSMKGKRSAIFWTSTTCCSHQSNQHYHCITVTLINLNISA